MCKTRLWHWWTITLVAVRWRVQTREERRHRTVQSSISASCLMSYRQIQTRHTHIVLYNCQLHSHDQGVCTGFWHLFWLKEIPCSADTVDARSPAVSKPQYTASALCVFMSACMRRMKWFLSIFPVQCFDQFGSSWKRHCDWLSDGSETAGSGRPRRREHPDARQSQDQSHTCVCVSLQWG